MPANRQEKQGVKSLKVQGAREHNLKDINVELPRGALVVISGLSGSGKSSLAFDTIYAEGQRRYVESLSAYARQFLGLMEKPDVDYIEGLSPAIAIEQKSTHRNPRSTVGTVTEIYDYLRLLYARVGQAYCPKCEIPIEEQSVDQILETVLHLPEDSRLLVLAPMLRNRKTEGQKLFEDARKSGFSRVRINGEERLLEENILLDKRYKYNIEIVVDRIKLSAESRRRLADAVETALELSGGQVQLQVLGRQKGEKEQELFFSEHNSCSECGYSLPELEPRLFSFNSPVGACEHCGGLGQLYEFDFDLLCPDPQDRSLKEGLLQLYRIDSSRWYRSLFKALAEVWGFQLTDSWNALTHEVQDKLLRGSSETISFRYRRISGGTSVQNIQFPGIFADLQQRYKEAESERMKAWFEEYMRQTECPACKGQRLKPGALSVYLQAERPLEQNHGSTSRLQRKNIMELCSDSISQARKFIEQLQLCPARQEISAQILKEIRVRLGFLESVGLDYLSLGRSAATLSGGEAQRIRLATQVGSQLTGVLYVLDEPSIGLHQRDNQKLIDTLLHLKSLDNTVIVVEHDEQTLRVADYIVDIGPGAGVHGGFVVAQGPPSEIAKVEASLTGQFLCGKLSIPVPAQRRAGNGKFLELTGVCEHNLKNIDVRIPLGTMTLITGVSGSGKSTLLEDVLYPAVFNDLKLGKKKAVGKFARLSGTEELKKVIRIDQSPIGRTSRSNPATYVGAWTAIRELFAALPDARARGYNAGRFSFNVKGGRCEACEGGGTRRIEMHFLPDVCVTCDVCNGKRFNQETLEVRYKGKNIHDVLTMTVEDGVDFFNAIPQVKHKLETLAEVGLAYMTLGQSAPTLSGGEAQRVKLAAELSKRGGAGTLYIIDEPTTGLHFADVKKLLEVLQSLVDKACTICMIEHNLDVIKQADYIIDMGPEGGVDGGQVIARGTPEQVSQIAGSHTGHFLKEVLNDFGK